jgi:quinol monooxygenase YgiN
MKKIVAQFNVVGLTAQQYAQANKDLEAAGMSNPLGRLYHVAAQQPDGFFMIEVWESEEALNGFAETLIPVLLKNGITPAKPSIVLPVHNIMAK